MDGQANIYQRYKVFKDSCNHGALQTMYRNHVPRIYPSDGRDAVEVRNHGGKSGTKSQESGTRELGNKGLGVRNHGAWESVNNGNKAVEKKSAFKGG